MPNVDPISALSLLIILFIIRELNENKKR